VSTSTDAAVGQPLALMGLEHLVGGDQPRCAGSEPYAGAGDGGVVAVKLAEVVGDHQ
jgi:hypothetical protein